MVRAAAISALVLTLCGAGCGSDSKEATPNVISAGQVDIQLPDGWTVTKNGVARPAGDSQNADGESASAAPTGATAEGSDETVPLAEEDPTSKFFKSLNTFQSCLKDLGVKFIGAPDPNNPSAPSNDPGYLENLGTCAAKSNIVQALQDQQDAQKNQTPAQIEEQNKGYLVWRECMIGLGWGIPEPKPDAEGRLFSFNGSSTGAQFEPPPGKDILTSDDLQKCANQAADSAPPAAEGG